MGLERHAGRLWATTLGGPLLVLEEHRLPSWRGLEDGDYDRARAVTHYVRGLEVGDGRGLVLGDEPAMTTAVQRADGVVFVRWHAADDSLAVERAITALESAPTVDAADQAMVLRWQGDNVIVLDAVEPGRDQRRFDLPGDQRRGEGALRVPFSTGQYAVRVGTVHPSAGVLSLVQLVRL